MQRRQVAAGLALALASPALAFAQDKAMSTASRGMAMGDAEMKHMQDTMAAGSLSLAMSRVAVGEAQDDDVKEFATFEVAEQETIADVLKGMKDPSLVSGSVKAPGEAEVEAMLDAKGKEMVQKLKQAKAGAAFDKDYVQGQIDGHKDLLAIQETYLKSGKNPQSIAVAKLARGQIKEHLTLLDDLKKNMG